ncbi:MAG: hypothetical protein PVSMB5_10100 [Ktedonobacteraceae bacterium]
MRTAQTTNAQAQRFVHVRLHQTVTLRKQYVATIPRWRRPLIGYFASILLVGGASLGTWLLRTIFISLSFPGSFFILSVLLAALFWGVGPAIFSLLLSTFVLDYFFVLPVGQLDLTNWNGIAQVLPYVISGLVIALITGQREQARWRSLATEQALQAYAEELEEANRQLKDTDQLKDRFLSIASHELKTPITSIRGQAQLALRRLAKQKTTSPEIVGMSTTLEKINEQTIRLTALVDELLDLSSIRAGKIELHKREFDLVALCQGIVEDQQLLTGRTIALTSETPTLQLVADCDRFSQVVTNLMTNAVKYSPEGSEVMLRLSRTDKYACIEVQDFGKGISDKQLPHIFDAFYRTPDAQASSKFGLGLGLAICKDIIERHGGRIWAESKVGKGSTFFVEVPLK